MADKVKAVFSVAAYAELLQMGQGTKTASELREQQAKARDGAYTHAVRASIVCRNEAAGDKALHYMLLDHTFQKLDQAIAFNVDDAAILFGAKLLKKPAKNGSKYAIPSNVASAKSQLLTACKDGVSLTYKGKDGEETEISFTKIRTLNDANRAKRDAIAALQLTGKPAKVFKATRALTVALGKVGDMDEHPLDVLIQHVMADAGITEEQLVPKVPETQPAPTAEAPKPEATQAASAPAKATKKGSKKAPQGAGDMLQKQAA